MEGTQWTHSSQEGPILHKSNFLKAAGIPQQPFVYARGPTVTPGPCASAKGDEEGCSLWRRDSGNVQHSGSARRSGAGGLHGESARSHRIDAAGGR